MTTHTLKCWTEQFAEVRSGRKTFEFRRDDRCFAVGDVLDLREFDPIGMMYSGQFELRRVKHILSSGFGLPDGYVVMSMEAVECCGQPVHDGDPCGYILECCGKYRTPSPVDQMLGWQDISTAPKTGEEFIARTGPEWSSFSCSWDGEMFVHYDRDDGIIAYGPKQWMPMPGPDAAPESPSDLSVGGAERLQDLEHLLESVRACYFVGRPDCPNEFVQSTWEKVKAADDARASLAPAEHVMGRWLPIAQADKTINHVTEFTEISLTLKNSDTFWVRDEDGRVYQAAWSEGNKGRDYWWDFEGESPVDPVEFMPHPLDPRFHPDAKLEDQP